MTVSTYEYFDKRCVYRYSGGVVQLGVFNVPCLNLFPVEADLGGLSDDFDGILWYQAGNDRPESNWLVSFGEKCQI